MNLKGIGCKGVEWINLAWDRERSWAVVNTAIEQNAGIKLRLQSKVCFREEIFRCGIASTKLGPMAKSKT